ncbi:MAG: hypothetical protein WDM78_08810 [Puia sp.]
MYRFESVGPKGIIKKVIQYTAVKSIGKNTYNLSFGDLNEISGEPDDTIVSNNNDTKKILLTVARSALEFSSKFPHARILVIGSTRSRTRLYQMTFRQHFEEIDKLFDIQGYVEYDWRKFETGVNYEAFLFTKKPNKQ